MYPIQLSHRPSKADQVAFTEKFSVFPKQEDLTFDYDTEVFKEAVFSKGKEKMKPLVDQFQVIKDKLEEAISAQSGGGAQFNPKEFIKSLEFKKLEDTMVQIFGFRNVDITHYREGYVSEDQVFQSMELQCITYYNWRYPIDGLVTDSGFYDKTRSLNTEILFSLGMIKELSAAELVAVFLHELGHNIDPALVDINFTVTNAWSKYLTDRKGILNKKEKEMISGPKKIGMFAQFVALAGVTLLALLINWIQNIAHSAKEVIFKPDEALNRIRQAVKSDKASNKFARQTNVEAFADNFARMYGFGPELASGFHKAAKFKDNRRRSRISIEKDRQKIIADITVATIKSKHKTHVHRINNLIQEYKKDLADPKLPAKVKKQIQEDLNEVEAVLKKYTNDFDDFQNKVNQVIIDELKIKLPKDAKEPDKKADKKDE